MVVLTAQLSDRDVVRTPRGIIRRNRRNPRAGFLMFSLSPMRGHPESFPPEATRMKQHMHDGAVALQGPWEIRRPRFPLGAGPAGTLCPARTQVPDSQEGKQVLSINHIVRTNS